MKRALKKDFYREIQRSLGRFLSIFCIVALGVSFFAGIRASEPDMRLSADEYFDEHRLADLKVVSTMGLTKDDAEALKHVEGVQSIEPGYSVDAMCNIDGISKVVHIMSRTSSMNEVTIEEGRLPQRETECFVDIDFLKQSGYRIGDRLTLTSGSEEALTDQLKETSFEIVGAGSSPCYISFERGSSMIGTGEVSGFVVVDPSAFHMDVFTELYLTVDGAFDQVAFTKEYEQLVAQTKDHVEQISGEREHIRYQNVMTEAEEEIGKAERELAEGEEELLASKKKLEDGKNSLQEGKSDALQELAKAKQKLVAGEEELRRGKEKFAKGKIAAANAKEVLLANENTLARARTQYEEGLKQWRAGSEELREKELEFQKQEAVAEEGIQRLEQAITDAQNGLTQLEEGIVQARAGLQTIGEKREQLEAAYQKGLLSEKLYQKLLSQVDTKEKELQDTLSTLQRKRTETLQTVKALQQKCEDTKQQLEDGRHAIAMAKEQLQMSEQQLQDAKQQLEDGEQELADGWKQWNASKKQLSEAERTIRVNEKKIQNGWDAYEDGQQKMKEKLASGETELARGEKQVADGEEKIESGKKELADARKELEELEQPIWYVSDREAFPEYRGYGENADRMRAIGQVFPVLFFLVAALISLTTMTRMVEEQRTQIGTLKALGYSKASIAGKYLGYASLATVGGSVFGVLAGEKLYPYIIVTAYKIMYPHLPNVVIPYNMKYAVMATVTAVLCTMAATMVACYKEMAAQPAVLMRPPSPKQGKRVFLERFPFLWKHFSFIWKSTIRNLIRYKKRFFMTVLGIGGCMALMLVGFGLRDSIYNIARIQYKDIQKYDMMAILDENGTDETRRDLETLVAQETAISDTLDSYMKNRTISHEGDEGEAYLFVASDEAAFSDFVVLQNRRTKERYTLPDDGVVLTEKIAKMLSVQVGDKIKIHGEEESEQEVVVAAICENYMGHYVYMTDETYETVFGKTPINNTKLCKIKQGQETKASQIGEQMLSTKAVMNVQYMKNMQGRIEDMLSTLDSVIIVLIAAAEMLAFVVLYNLNNINITERRRELATIKVLGFYDKEVAAYVYRENVLLTLIGTIVGCGLGFLLHRFVIVTVEVNDVMFGRNMEPESYLIAMFFTIAFSVFVNWVMYFKLKRIDMVESLKSVE